MEWAGEGVEPLWRRRQRELAEAEEEEEEQLRDFEAEGLSEEEIERRRRQRMQMQKKKEEREELERQQAAIPTFTGSSPVFLPEGQEGGAALSVKAKTPVRMKKEKPLERMVDWENPGESVVEAATKAAEEGYRRWTATSAEDEWKNVEMMSIVEQVKRFRQRVKHANPHAAIAEYIEEQQLGIRTLRKLPKGILRPGAWSGRDPVRDGSIDAKDDGKDSTLGRMAVAVHKGFLRLRAQAHPAASQLGGLPMAERPEVAFIGASNVGKSSLMNAITRTQKLAAAKHEKGLTRQIMWYKCSRLPMDVIDLPGYGVAKGADFGPSLAHFVAGRKALRALYVLVDAQSGLVRKDWKWLASLGADGPPKIFVLTKCDLVPPKDLCKVATVVLEDMRKIPKAMQRLVMVSAKMGPGMHDLRCDLCARAIAFTRQIKARKEARLAAQEENMEPASAGSAG